MEFNVSVVIPVYKAEKFVVDAVESTVNIPDVKQILLIEDGSPDSSLALCLELAKKYSKVEVMQHPNGINKGAGASRNLGILNSKYEYLSFLDADDYYLPNRFSSSKEILMNDPEVDFTYGVSQYDYNYAKKNNKFKRVKTIDDQSKLFRILLKGNKGFFCTNAITIRKSSLLEISLFNTDLVLHQDSEMWLRMAYYLTGRQETLNEPTSIVRRHSGNRFVNRNTASQLLLWKTVYSEFKHKNLERRDMQIISEYLKYYSSHRPGNALTIKLKYYLLALKVRLL
jgi:glycosyltransferase involved in cell wall biosynthesis